MVVKLREELPSLDEHLQHCLIEVASNRAILEQDYVRLLDLDLIHQPLAVGLPPLTPLGFSLLNMIPYPVQMSA